MNSLIMSIPCKNVTLHVSNKKKKQWAILANNN